MAEVINNRIIIIDDEEIIRHTVSEILTGKESNNQSLKDAENELFGYDSQLPSPSSSELYSFQVDCAPDGKTGWAMVKEAHNSNKPYAAAFIDMRMPVWDGLKTAKMIREIDPRIEIVFLTAYSDYSVEDLVKDLGRNIGYHCKPFERSEIRQIATKLCSDWSRLRDLELLIASMSELYISGQNFTAIKRTVGNILTTWLPVDSLLLFIQTDNSTDCLVATGNYERLEQNPEKITSTISGVDFNENSLTDKGGVVTYKLGSYFLIVSGEELSGYRKDKLFLMQLFVESVSKTFENIRLNQKVKEKEKLSVVGEAIAKVVHDLRMPAGFARMAIDLIRDSPEDKEQTDQLMDLMIRSSLDMECYIDEHN